MLKKHSKFLIPGIIVIGMVLRIPFTSIPPIISHIAEDGRKIRLRADFCCDADCDGRRLLDSDY